MSNDLCELSRDARRASLAATRMLVCEEQFEALVDLLIESGAVRKRDAKVMLHRLSLKLRLRAEDQIETDYVVHQAEMADHASRIADLAHRLGDA